MKRTPLRRKARLQTRTRLAPLNRERTKKRRKKYAAYLRSPVWRALRFAALFWSEFRCSRCGTQTLDLEAHHKTYARFGGQEWLDDLEALCGSCHTRHHAQHDGWKRQRYAVT